MRKIAICDDKIEVFDFIKRACEKFYFKKSILEITYFRSGEDIIKSDKHFDVIFMDVELGNLNGIEAGLEIRKTDHDVLIIMISAHEKYKMNAYPLHAFNFLDKPFTENDIFNVLKEVERYCDKKKEHIFVSFKIKEGYTNFDISDILYFESINRKINLITKNKTYEFYGSISEIAKQMKEYGFGVPHSSFVVNFMCVKTMNSKEIIILNGHSIPMTKYKTKEFMSDYATFQKNQLRKWKV